MITTIKIEYCLLIRPQTRSRHSCMNHSEANIIRNDKIGILNSDGDEPCTAKLTRCDVPQVWVYCRFRIVVVQWFSSTLKSDNFVSIIHLSTHPLRHLRSYDQKSCPSRDVSAKRSASGRSDFCHPHRAHISPSSPSAINIFLHSLDSYKHSQWIILVILAHGWHFQISVVLFPWAQSVVHYGTESKAFEIPHTEREG